MIAINVPVATGQLYRTATALRRVGVTYPFRRLWQDGFISPHLSYFTPTSIERLFTDHGYELVARSPLFQFEPGGLYRRMSLDSRMTTWRALLLASLLTLDYPISRLVPDQMLFLFARSSRDGDHHRTATGTDETSRSPRPS